VPEHVLVVPRARLFRNGGFYGFRREGLVGYLAAIAGYAFFARRDQVEENPSLKQIIPYTVVRHAARIFLVGRTRRGSEARLREKLSIGLGGHINPVDNQPDLFPGTAAAARGIEPQAVEPGRGPAEGEPAGTLVDAAMARELTEEVELPPGWRARPVGALNDDVEAVGRVHFGLVYVADVPSPDVRIRETTKLTGAFATMAEVRDAYSRLESWSQFILDGFDPLEA
jgi:predicted NUDIX family phosphoesterase